MAGNVEPKLQKYFYAGITQDKYLPIKNSCADAKWVDIFGWDVILSTHSQSNIITLPNNSYPTSIWDVITSNNWYIYDLNGNMIYDISNTTGYTNVRNYIDHTIGWVTYRLLIASKFIHRYTPDALYTYSDLDGGGTNRAFDGDYIVHTAWSTAVFIWTNTAVVGKQYVLNISVSNRTAGSFTIKIWNDTPQTVSLDWDYVLHFTAWTTAWVIITPSSDFNGKIYVADMIGACSLEEAYITLTNTSLLAPAIVDNWYAYIGNWNVVFCVDTDWKYMEALTLPKNEEIIEITRDANYILLWTRSSKYSKVYFWDGITWAPSGNRTRKNDIIQLVENQWDFCVVVTGNNNQTKKVWKTNWYSRQLIMYVPYGNWSTTTSSETGMLPVLPIYFSNVDANWNNVNTNNSSSFGDMVFIPWKDSVIVYGRKNPSLPFAFVNQYPLVNASEIYTIYAENDTLYIGYNDWVLDDAKIVEYKIEPIRYTGIATTDSYYGNFWYINMLPVIGLWTDINHGVSIDVWQSTPADTFMVLLYKINQETDRFTIVVDTDVNPISILPTVGSIYKFGSSDRITITSVETKLNYTYISVQKTTEWNINFNDNQITKASGTGDNTITFVAKYNFRLLDIIDGALEVEDNLWNRMIPETFNEIEFSVLLVTTDGLKTPILKDITLYRDKFRNG